MRPHILFDTPSLRFDEGLPLGNGRLGAVVTGGLPEKHILLNEETVWYGGPRDRNNPDAIQTIGRMREMMRTGQVREAEQLALLALTGTPETQRHYSTLGMVVLNFLAHTGRMEDYQRILDLETAVVTETYRIDGISYQLTAFVSQPDQVLAIRLRASQPVLNFTATIERGERVGNFSYGTHMDAIVRHGREGLVMRGHCGGEHGLIFRGALFGASTGVSTLVGSQFVVNDAAEAVLMVAGGTNYETEAIEDLCVSRCKTALQKGFDACLRDHLAEWQPLFGAASVELDHPAVPAGPLAMNRVFDAYTRNDLSVLPQPLTWQALEDHLVVVLFAFGRYLLLSSSRSCVLPANLQGIWCRDLLPIWDAKFTTNINLQMAYWPADAANLSACFEAYLQLAERIRENGLVTAQTMYSCRGFVLHNNTDIWADTAVQDAGTHCSYWFLGGVWIAVDLWEHYRYTHDLDFLARAWPILRDALLFVLDFMEVEDGQLVMGVTSSPENIYLSAAGQHLSFCRMSAMDAELIALLLRDCLQALDVLQSNGRDEVEMPQDFRAQVEIAAAMIAPPRIGADGAILEWGFEVDEAYPDHRHQSHLIGAYPYHGITEREPELWQAVRHSIEKRIRNGGVNNGWSRAWTGGLMARLGDGNSARDLLGSMVRHSSLPNLFSCCNIRQVPKLMEDNKPLQMDGNLGAVQAVIEMLLHSHNEEIVLLPALPDSWEAGSFHGLVARGNVVVDARWQDHRLVTARLLPRVDGRITVVTGAGYIMELADGAVVNDHDGRFSITAVRDAAVTIRRSESIDPPQAR
ncbi:MAG: glycoside hydrolase family 95 protein [Anaerolineae bacterium]|nr:glycoside hydrolase family 95 protein [Anaerolineae bacterium]